MLNLNRPLLASLLLASLLAFASGCDDDSGGTDAGPMTADSGGGGTDAGPADTDAGPADTDAGPADTDAGPADTDAGPADTDAGPGGPSTEATAFCTAYETTCGFGAMRYADTDACTTAFDGYETSRQMCVTTHLGLAEAGMTNLHCGHATGNAPCG